MLRSSLEKPLFLLIILIYLIAACFIGGFHHPDEQYQIIHWANFKSGNVSLAEMPWEYPAHIRSALQPGICYLIFKGADEIGISDPFYLALILRLLSAAYALFAIRFAMKNTGYILSIKVEPVYLSLFYLLWFLPYICVRYSSESWAGTTFLLCLAVAAKPYKIVWIKYVLLGILCGLVFAFRYQCAFMILGLTLWLLIIKKIGWKPIFIIAAAGLLVLLVCLFIDRWMYGVWAFSAYNYFKANIIDNVASKYGVLPWYYIFRYMLFDTGLPFGLMIVLAVLTFLRKELKSPVLWSCIPLIAVHLIIPHKELRFLFPLAILVPLVLASAYATWRSSIKTKYLFWGCTVVLGILNLAALSTVLSKSTHNGENDVQRVLHQIPINQKINLLTSAASNPYDPYMKYSYNFYKTNNLNIEEITSIWAPDFESHIKSGMANFLILSNSEITGNETLNKLQMIGAKKIDIHLIPHFHTLEQVYDPERFDRELNLFCIDGKNWE